VEKVQNVKNVHFQKVIHILKNVQIIKMFKFLKMFRFQNMFRFEKLFNCQIFYYNFRICLNLYFRSNFEKTKQKQKRNMSELGCGTGTCKKQLMGRPTFLDRGDHRCGKSGKGRYKRWKGAP
jgi:hypothetical protein